MSRYIVKSLNKINNGYKLLEQKQAFIYKNWRTYAYNVSYFLQFANSQNLLKKYKEKCRVIIKAIIKCHIDIHKDLSNLWIYLIKNYYINALREILENDEEYGITPNLYPNFYEISSYFNSTPRTSLDKFIPDIDSEIYQNRGID